MSEFDALDFVEIDVPEVGAAQMEVESDPDPSAIGEAISSAFDRLGVFLRQLQLNPSGPPRIIYTAYSPDKVTFTLAMPVNTSPTAAAGSGSAHISPLAGGKHMRFTHRGAYSDMRNTYERITEFLKAEELIEHDEEWLRYMPMWEEYISDPDTTPEADLLTYIYLPKL